MKQHLCSMPVDDLDIQSQSSSVSKLGKSCEGIPVTRQRCNEKPPILMQRCCIYVSRPEKSSCKNTDKVLQCMDLNATELIFLGCAKTIKSYSIRRQAQIKMKIARIMMEEFDFIFRLNNIIIRDTNHDQLFDVLLEAILYIAGTMSEAFIHPSASILYGKKID